MTEQGALGSLYVYWCPICEAQTERSWHSLHDGGLFPQSATEHDCERIEVVPLQRLRDVGQALTDLQHRMYSWRVGGEGSPLTLEELERQVAIVELLTRDAS